MFTLQSSRPFAELRDKLPSEECFEGLHRKTISDACHPEDSNTLQVLDILKMSLFGLQSKTVLSSKITCHVLCHCSPCSRCTIVPRAVSPGT